MSTPKTILFLLPLCFLYLSVHCHLSGTVPGSKKRKSLDIAEELIRERDYQRSDEALRAFLIEQETEEVDQLIRPAREQLIQDIERDLTEEGVPPTDTAVAHEFTQRRQRAIERRVARRMSRLDITSSE